MQTIDKKLRLSRETLRQLSRAASRRRRDLLAIADSGNQTQGQGCGETNGC